MVNETRSRPSLAICLVLVERSKGVHDQSEGVEKGPAKCYFDNTHHVLMKAAEDEEPNCEILRRIAYLITVVNHPSKTKGITGLLNRFRRADAEVLTYCQAQ